MTDIVPLARTLYSLLLMMAVMAAAWDVMADAYAV